jgi:hypothetical protein
MRESARKHASLPVTLALVAVLTGSVLAATAAEASCLDETDPGAAADAAQIAALRFALQGSYYEPALCICYLGGDGLPGTDRGSYLDCVMDAVDEAVAEGRLRRECRATVRRLEARSRCGRDGFQIWKVCIEKITRGAGAGRVRCTVRPTVKLDRVTSLERCRSEPGMQRSMCFDENLTHCIDAADTNGDLRIDADDSGRCPVCGNGRIEATEECDGQEFCGRDCRIQAPSCCQTPSGLCVDGSDSGTLGTSCYRYLYGTSSPGYCTPPPEGCEDPPGPLGCGTCQEQPVTPAPLCCQKGSTCIGSVATDTTALSRFDRFDCNHAPFGPDRLVFGTCGDDGRCVPDPP